MSQDVVWTLMETPLGGMIAAAREDGLVGLWFDGQEHFAGVAPGWRQDDHAPVLAATAAQVEEYFAGRRTAFDLPLAELGTDFQRAVWRAIAAIPRGATASYGAVAATVGRPGAARAVGAATGRNPWSIIVPCHRLLGAGGALTGYAGGLARKRALLSLEGVPS